MGFNWSGLVVRAPDEAAFESIRVHDPSAMRLPGGFARVGWDRSTNDWAKAGTTTPWSSKLGEAWYFEAASTSGVFGYEHGKDGILLRSLGFFSDGGWLLVEGDPEPWEAEIWGGALPVEGDAEPEASPELVVRIAQFLGTELLR